MTGVLMGAGEARVMKKHVEEQESGGKRRKGERGCFSLVL